MSHGRQQVRDAVVTAVTGLTTTATRVYSGRVYPHDALPSLAVYSAAEEVQDDQRTRMVDIIVEARTKATADLDDSLDDICAEVETAISADDTLGLSGTICAYPPRTEFELEAELEQPVGVATMTFPVLYRVAFTAPETLI